MAADGMRLAGICGECMKRLGVDERLTIPMRYVEVSQLPEYNAKTMAGIQFPAGSSKAFGLGRGGHHGTTKITYKIAKTVKETIDEHASGSHNNKGGGGSSAADGKSHQR